MAKGTDRLPALLEPPLPRVRLVYDVEARRDQFLLEEDEMPETPLHDQIIELLKAILSAWAARSGRDIFVARNLACRWEPRDARIGVDPDICLIEPSPPNLETMKQLRLWDEGHTAPWLAIEVVSASTSDKDYLDAQVRYVHLGVRELWIFDPHREGPDTTGGPFLLQVWRREGDVMQRCYAGDGPFFSESLGAWITPVQKGSRLRIADDEAGTLLWPTAEEHLARRLAALEALAGEKKGPLLSSGLAILSA